MNNEKKAEKAYWEAFNGINIKKNEQIVLECKTNLSYYFSRNVSGADIKAHEQIILNLKDPEYCCLFTKDVSGADIKAHEQVILEIKDPQYSYWFAKHIPGANIEEHFKVVLNSGSKFWLDMFTNYVNYKGTKVEEWLLYI